MSKTALAFAVLLLPLLLTSSYAEDKPAASPASPKIGTVQRRVLIFDFENHTGKIEFDYLSGSISDALADSIKKTGKFRLMLREDARVNAIADGSPAPANAVPGEANSVQGTSSEPPMANAPPKVNVAVNRNDAIKRGRDAGADVVVLGKFSELNGVLLMSAQAYEADTRLLKVAEEILTKSDSEMFNGINVLANKIAESMARELPMFDAAEAERRNAEPNRNKIEERNWELQVLGGFPYMHGLYGTDGTVGSGKGFPVHKFSGYSLGAAFWHTSLEKKIYFLPKGFRLGLTTKLTLASGTADIVAADGQMISGNTKLTTQLFAGYLMMGVPYLQRDRFVLLAELGGGATYGRVLTPSDQIFASVLPGVVVGTSAAYHFSYWSVGLSYRAQAWFLSTYRAFLQHDAYFYVGLRL